MYGWVGKYCVESAPFFITIFLYSCMYEPNFFTDSTQYLEWGVLLRRGLGTTRSNAWPLPVRHPHCYNFSSPPLQWITSPPSNSLYELGVGSGDIFFFWSEKISVVGHNG